MKSASSSRLALTEYIAKAPCMKNICGSSKHRFVMCSSLFGIIVQAKVIEGIPFPLMEWTLLYVTATVTTQQTSRQTSSRLCALLPSSSGWWGSSSVPPDGAGSSRSRGRLANVAINRVHSWNVADDDVYAYNLLVAVVVFSVSPKEYKEKKITAA